ncbi:hypothetical protein FXO37_24723 [Capsicum annuum]|nr:hypothetical protein FXO37_24723 [Capsicum annuum]
MMGSSTIVGWVSNDGSSTMKRYYLGGQSPSEVVSDQGNLELVNITSSIVDKNSRIYMAFQLNTEMSRTDILPLLLLSDCGLIKSRLEVVSFYTSEDSSSCLCSSCFTISFELDFGYGRGHVPTGYSLFCLEALLDYCRHEQHDLVTWFGLVGFGYRLIIMSLLLSFLILLYVRNSSNMGV